MSLRQNTEGIGENLVNLKDVLTHVSLRQNEEGIVENKGSRRPGGGVSMKTDTTRKWNERLSGKVERNCARSPC